MSQRADGTYYYPRFQFCLRPIQAQYLFAGPRDLLDSVVSISDQHCRAQRVLRHSKNDAGTVLPLGQTHLAY